MTDRCKQNRPILGTHQQEYSHTPKEQTGQTTKYQKFIKSYVTTKYNTGMLALSNIGTLCDRKHLISHFAKEYYKKFSVLQIEKYCGCQIFFRSFCGISFGRNTFNTHLYNLRASLIKMSVKYEILKQISPACFSQFFFYLSKTKSAVANINGKS